MAEPASAPTPEDVSLLFSPVASGRTSELIVDQLRLLIRKGQLNPGSRLPSERALCERLGVSRVTVREALRFLETNGLVEIRTGARGGAFVTSPSGQRVGQGFSDGLADLLFTSSLKPTEVAEVRRVIELGIIPLVCERATDEDLDHLDELCAQAQVALKNSAYTMAHSAQFHVALAGCAHNLAVDLLLRSFRGALLETLQEAQDHAPEMGPVGVKEHVALVSALRRRDEDECRTILERHLDRTAQRVAMT